ncbi:hypothetical protein LTSEGIV_2454 [Salmonella enterica subsp. enterica serovar Give str. S5-487]|nr:hypothetical protein LTSEGIV_2454 [Salmonella enterica subsp. enterica serovar Give str. S5-487]
MANDAAFAHDGSKKATFTGHRYCPPIKGTFTGRFLLSQITLRPAPEFYILPQFL